MALLSFAGSPHGGSHKLLPEWDSQPKITPIQIIDHTIVGTALGAWWFFHDSTGIESHFIIRGRQSGTADGYIWQLMDTGRQADANLEANNKAISIETEDNGDRPIEKWSDAQLASLDWLHNKLEAVHPGIKRQNANTCTRAGLGYHSQLGAPSCRTPSVGKDCPAPARIAQWGARLLPAFLHPLEEDDGMAEITQARFNELMNDWADSNAGKDALRQALYPPIARGEFDGTLSTGHAKDSVRNAVAQGRFLRGGELTDPDGTVNFSVGHYMDSQRHLARELRALVVGLAAAHGLDPATLVDAPGQAQATLPGAVSPEPPGAPPPPPPPA